MELILALKKLNEARSLLHNSTMTQFLPQTLSARQGSCNITSK